MAVCEYLLIHSIVMYCFSGDTLRWKIWPWSKCVDGKQIRAVRCYHFFAEKEYHVIVDACIKYVAPMPAKERDC
ncbi:Hypothetical predicted protein [Paramuricea clavata]|uniref:Uncharacterized protein n=1 Tax=Paramuricea clavata TaxID=317549 RepID=A0A6S7GPL1_PARCT|nr:Hypothetical predicted protein [Paramuricea clavata]